MALRIGVDLDGVVADMESELVRQAERLFGESMTRLLEERAKGPEPPADHEPPEGAAEIVPRLVKLQMTSRQERRLWRHVELIEGFWESLDELEPGVIARLGALAAERRWEVIFLTKRPETAGATAQVQTQRWLEARGFALPSVFVVHGSRGLVAHALNLDFVIDDRPENCLDVVVDSRARAILVWRDADQALPVTVKRLGIGIVRTVGECLNILVQVDSTGREKPGFFDRVKQRLGFKEPAGV